MNQPGSPARGRARRPWRPRAALGWGMLLFVGIQAALVAALEYRPGARDVGYSVRRARLRRRLAERPGRPLVLMVGSSRCMFGFRPADLPPCRPPGGEEPLAFNCAIEGGGPLMDLIFLRRLLAEGVRPDWLLVECWPLAEDNGAFTLVVRPQRMGWRDLGVLRRYNPDPRQVYREWGELRLLPGFMDRATLLGEVAPRWGPPSRDHFLGIDDGGWVPCPWGYTPAQHDLLSRRARENYQLSLANYRHDATCDRIFRDLLALCRREGIRAALVYLPEARWFRDMYSPTTRAEVADYLGRLSRDCDVPVIDARDWVADEDFADGYHLLSQGARAFTTRLGEEALRPLLAGRAVARKGDP